MDLLVHFGATCSAFLRRRNFMAKIPHDIIIGAGVAAAISSVFSAPLAGIVFSQIILRHFSMKALTAISLSSISASIIAKEMNLMSPILEIKELSFSMFEAVLIVDFNWNFFINHSCNFYEIFAFDK